MPLIPRLNPAPHPPPTVGLPTLKMGPPTSNRLSLPSSTQMKTALPIRAEHQLSKRTGRSCIASPCPRSVSNWVVSRSHQLSSSHQKDSRNRTGTVIVIVTASIARTRARTHVPTPHQIGSSPNYFGSPLTEAWKTFVLSSEVNGVTYPKANDGGRTPLGDRSK